MVSDCNGCGMNKNTGADSWGHLVPSVVMVSLPARPRVPLSAAAWIVVGIAGWVGLTVIGAQLAAMVPPRAGDDLRLLIDAATRWHEGARLYASAGTTAPLLAEGLFYSYPPLVAQALAPFAALPFGVVLGGWAIGAIVGLAAVASRLGRMGRNVTLPAVALAAFVYPFAIAVLFGNLNAWFPLLFGLVLLAVLSPARASAVAGGLALAVASAAKLHPATLGVWLLARRWHDGPTGPSGRILAVAVMGGVGLFVASLLVGGTGPWGDYVTFLRGGAVQADIVNPLNIGPASQIALALGLSEAAARTIQLPVTLAALAATVAAGRRLDDPVASFGVATIVSLVALPVTWFHYPVALLPVAIAAAARADHAARPATLVALFVALIAAGVAILTPVAVWVAVALVLCAVYASRPHEKSGVGELELSVPA
jgi:Glycosyltransferase family 87